MWSQRLGAFGARRMLLTGDTIDGHEAVSRGLALAHYQSEIELDAGVRRLVQRLATVPANQLAMQKLLCNAHTHASGLEVFSILFPRFLLLLFSLSLSLFLCEIY